MTGTKSKPDTSHARKTYRKAIREAKKDDTTAVLLNRGYNRLPEVQIKPNRRPDVLVVKKDGQINAHEVASKTDEVNILFDRNKEVRDKLPTKMKGEVTVEKYKKKD